MTASVYTEWFQAGTWSYTGSWRGICTHCCLSEEIRGFSREYWITYEERGGEGGKKSMRYIGLRRSTRIPSDILREGDLTKKQPSRFLSLVTSGLSSQFGLLIVMHARCLRCPLSSLSSLPLFPSRLCHQHVIFTTSHTVYWDQRPASVQSNFLALQESRLRPFKPERPALRSITDLRPTSRSSPPYLDNRNRNPDIRLHLPSPRNPRLCIPVPMRKERRGLQFHRVCFSVACARGIVRKDVDGYRAVASIMNS